MGVKSYLVKLYGRVQAFGTARGGNVAIIFTLALIPLMAATGAAVDYSRANSMRTALQSAVDSAGLMLAKEAPDLAASQIAQKGEDYIKALFTRPEAQNLQIAATYDTSKGIDLTLVATASIDTAFAGIIGIPSMSIKASTHVKTGQTLLRVALVLDNTGSMSSDGKMTALKNATKKLLTLLKDAAKDNGDVYVSIIPFVKDVNVGASNYNASWIDWTDWDNKNGECSSNKYKNQIACSGAAKKWTTADHSTWNGCITDRGKSSGPDTGNYDTNVSLPDMTSPATLFPAEQYKSCPAAMLPLSYNWSAMTTAVNNMSPNGTTNQAIGLVHGWQSLVGGGPYPAPPAKISGYQYSENIILMTDGLNTANRWYKDQSKIDARQQMTCNNIKTAGITLYTIQVNTGGDPISTLLQNCASSPDKFFHLTSANQLISAFEQIGTELSKLRIAK